MKKQRKTQLLKETLKTWFHFTKLERKGIVSLMLLGLTLLGIQWGVSLGFKSRFATPDDLSAIAAQLREGLTRNAVSEHREVDPFPFDPNTVAYEDLLLLGLPARTARSIDNYRNKGGRFRRPDDLQKIYTLSQEDFERLRPFIRIQARGSQPARHTGYTKRSQERAQPKPAELFAFDPNTATERDFVRLGLAPRLAQRIVNYREKGGVFRKIEDLARIYGMKESDFERLAPYVTIAPRESAPRPVMASGGEGMTGASTTLAPLDINSATAEDWRRLPGIGEARAEKILRFREKLGGFVSIAQVGETYNLPDSVFQKIRPFLVIGGTALRTLNINTADVAALSAHPYLTRKQAELMVAYREQHGPYVTLDDLFRIHVFAAHREGLTRALPYLSVK